MSSLIDGAMHQTRRSLTGGGTDMHFPMKRIPGHQYPRCCVGYGSDVFGSCRKLFRATKWYSNAGETPFPGSICARHC